MSLITLSASEVDKESANKSVAEEDDNVAEDDADVDISLSMLESSVLESMLDTDDEDMDIPLELLESSPRSVALPESADIELSKFKSLFISLLAGTGPNRSGTALKQTPHTNLNLSHQNPPLDE